MRSGWLWALGGLMLAILLFAGYNGYTNVSQRTSDITEAVKELAESDATMLENIAKIEAGEEIELPYWRLPTEPSVVGARHPRLAAMDASDLAILATGQSDMYSHYMKTGSYGENFALDIAEISNPIQLLFGTFDLAFVFMFIIPLLIIAFTYNVLSKELELGTLRVLGSQPIQVSRWLVQKMLIRYVLFAVISIVIFLGVLALYAPQVFQSIGSVSYAVLHILAYELFWFVLAGVVNIKVNHSAKNAMILVGLWILFVLIIPVAANQLGNTLYPQPSRLLMLNDIRHINKKLEEKRDQILDSYLQDHPELATGKDDAKYNFWHKYYASQDLLRAEVEPMLAKHEEAFQNREKVVNYLKYFSPAIILHESFSKLAGTSARDYDNYKQQVIAYKEAWRGHIIPLLFKGEKYTKARYEERPVFKYLPHKHSGLILQNILVTFLMTIVVFLLARFLLTNKIYHT